MFRPSVSVRSTSWLGLVLVAIVGASFAAQSLPIEANQNHRPAGMLRDGTLTIHLEIAKGEWHPEADDGMALSIYAFREVGHPLQNPGPLIRVPRGTQIQASLHNTLDVPITIHGLGSSKDGTAVARLEPGAEQQLKLTADTPGLYLYWASTETDDLKLRYGIDSELTGALVVDPPGAVSDDEIFVIELMSDVAGLSARQTLATINGKSWPYTQRFKYQMGDTVHWRWINATNEPHALHLHGFYYHVDSRNRSGHIENYAGDARPLVVTERIAQGDSFDMSWSPDRAGQWLFHCHMFQHMTPPIVPKVPGLAINEPLPTSNEHSAHGAMGMGQMVLGITVLSSSVQAATTAWHPQRKLQLEITERAGRPRYAVRLRDPSAGTNAMDKPGLIGPPIVLTRGEPIEIEVLNRLSQPTAIHWHGIELESYYDGVPGWSGAGNEITPAIAPGDSFVARMTPPRAGTFIYHTHWHEPSQLTNGLYGPLIVLPPGQRFDPLSDLTFVFSIGDFEALHEIALINGTPQNKTRQLQAGKKYRFRFINISTNNQGMQVSLRNPSGPVEWKVIAKDGADLPLETMHTSKAAFTISVGETYDVEFSSASPQDLVLELLLPGQKIHVTQTLAFANSSTNPQ